MRYPHGHRHPCGVRDEHPCGVHGKCPHEAHDRRPCEVCDARPYGVYDGRPCVVQSISHHGIRGRHPYVAHGEEGDGDRCVMDGGRGSTTGEANRAGIKKLLSNNFFQRI